MPYQAPQCSRLQESIERVPPGFHGGFAHKLPAEQIHRTVQPHSGRKGIERLNIKMAYLLSLLWHLALPVGLAVVNLLLFLLLGIDLFSSFAKPKPEPRDIEFVLAPPQSQEVAPIHPDTHRRARQNMRAGGEHNPAKPVHLSQSPQASAQAIAQATWRQATVISSGNPVQSSLSEVPPAEKPPPLSQNPLRPSLSEPAATLPEVESSHSTPSSSGSPLLADSSNPDIGNKNDPPGVDAIKEPDFGPYMQELQRRIKQSWHPPRGNESRQVVVAFQVSRSGQLNRIEITRSSGVPLADQAALAAVEQVFPFRSLPPEYTEEDIDIEFTFDYNVFGEKQRIMEESFNKG